MRSEAKFSLARLARLGATLLLALLLAFPIHSALAQRGGRSFGGGSFGGGSRSFGGGGGSFGGGRSSSGSFGGGRSSSGSFGGGGGSFGGGRSSSGSFGSGRSSSSGSFGRSGSFGGGGGITRSSTSYSYGGHSGYYRGGGYSSYWFTPSWYYWTPFHPAFYYSRPIWISDPGYPEGGYYASGGISWFHLLLSLIFFGFVIWLLIRLFGGGKRVKYTSH